MKQRREQLFALALRGQAELGRAARQRQQVGDQRDLITVASARRDQVRELAEPLLGRVVMREACGPFELRDKGMERAVLMVRRAEIAQPRVRPAFEPLAQRRGQPRFADARLARQQYHLPLARRGALPAAQQLVQFLLASDERRQRAGAQRLEPAFDRARPQRLPDRQRRREALDLDRAEIAQFEEIANEPPGALCDHDAAGRRQLLHARREVRRFADDAALLCFAVADQIADDDQPARDADAGGERSSVQFQPRDPLGEREAGAHRALGIVLMRLRIAEIAQHAVSHIFRDKAPQAADLLGHRRVIGAVELSQILGVEPRRQCGRTDQIAEHDGQLPAFGFGPR